MRTNVYLRFRMSDGRTRDTQVSVCEKATPAMTLAHGLQFALTDFGLEGAMYGENPVGVELGLKPFAVAQRTAGGDAEYLRLLTLVENCIARHNNGLQYFEDVRAAATEVAVQPVAEAAAQACPNPAACDAQGCINPRGHCEEAAAKAAEGTQP